MDIILSFVLECDGLKERENRYGFSVCFFFLGTIQNWRSNLAKEKFSQAKSLEYLFFMNSQFTPLPLFHFTDVTR